MSLTEQPIDPKGWMMLKVLINRYSPRTGEALLRFLPQEEVRELKAQNIHSNDLMPLLYQPQRLIERIHYSWLQPIMEKFSRPMQLLFLGVVTPEQASAIQPEATPPNLSAPIKTFLVQQLYEKLNVSHLLPIEYLPETDFSSLLNWSKRDLTVLADFLGLHDLARDIRTIVNNQQLQNLYACLTPKEVRYLKICLHQKDKLISPKLGVDFSQQDCTKLRQVLHKRGLVRLGKALAEQHPDLIWYISHTLDIGRGSIVIRSCDKEADANITLALKLQVTNLMNFLKKE